MRFWPILGVLLFLSIILGVAIPPVYSVETTIYVSPKWSRAFIGETYMINTTIANVTNLSNWQLELSFDPRILNCTQVLNPTTDPDNIFADRPDVWFPDPEINNTEGFIRSFCGLGPGSGVDGSGNLCQIEFKTIKLGVSTLNIIVGETATYIHDPNNSPIPFEVINGTIEVTDPSLEPYTFDVTQNGDTYQVIILSNSTVTSLDYNQTFKEMSLNVIGPDGTTGYSSVASPKKLLNDTVTILINNDPTCHLSQSFNTLPENATHCFVCLTYTHSTRYLKIRQTVPGDLNGDRKTDMKDIATAARAFGSYPGHPRWWPPADINFDNKVDMKDIAMIARNYGKRWRIL